MRMFQTWRDYAAQVVLVRDLPVLTPLVRRRLVTMHTETYREFSERDAAAREPHLRALFDAAVDAYVRASKEGYPEIHAREIAHVMGTWAFLRQGWGELVEFPPREAEAYYRRYSEFYDRHGCAPADPLGEFAPPGGLPPAPSTPERMQGEYPLAEPGLADEVYAVADDLDVRLPDGTAEKGAVDATAGDDRG
ncbi:MAG: DUF6149 family protein [Haloferacaceae archaeon]